ncbi:LysR family transcriptional regulator [Rhodobacter lacus]|uniref:LysR family transcriptional regulator n=1 Tax=Rhodobacter lacus TaxID=1641972 RepID=A0ABW5A9V6_9RHOB
MAPVPRSTLEQWTVLRTVVEEGSFAAAAQRLHRSQSSVSYAIARLQDALGVDLLELRGRRAVLTPAGAMLLSEAVPLIDDLARIERQGHTIAQGGREQIRLLVDTLFPRGRLFSALEDFVQRFPDTEIHLTETVRLTVLEADPEDFELAILIADPGAPDINLVGEVHMVAVAAADHPLVAAGPAPGPAALARHPCVEIRGIDAPGGRQGRGRVWRMNTVESAIGAVRRGLCYGWLPAGQIRADLEAGRLQPIPLARGATRPTSFGLKLGRGAEDDGIIAELAALLQARHDSEPQPAPA